MKKDFLISHSGANVCGLGKAWRQIYDALPPPPPPPPTHTLPPLHRTLSAVRPFLFLQGPSQSQAQFIQQRRARGGCGQLQRARRRDLLLISMRLHAAAFHTSPLAVAIIPTEDE